MPGTRGAGSGAERRHSDAARGIKQFLLATRTVTGSVEVHVIASVRHAATITRLVGFRVTGFTAILENSTVRHTLRHHGDRTAEAKRGQVAVTEDDLSRIPQILFDFDTAESAEATKQGTSQIRLHKRLGSIDCEVFCEVRRSACQIAFKTMIKRLKRGKAPS